MNHSDATTKESPEAQPDGTSETARDRIEHLEPLVKADPGHHGFFELATLYFEESDDPKRALEVLRGALDIHPDHIDARLLLGRIYLSRGRHRSCVRHMARLLHSHPTLVPAMKLLGRGLLAEGKAEEAWVVLRRAQDTLGMADPELSRLLRQAGGQLRRPQATEDGVLSTGRRGERITQITSASTGKPTRPKGFTQYIRQVAIEPTTHVGLEAIDPSEAMGTDPHIRLDEAHETPAQEISAVEVEEQPTKSTLNQQPPPLEPPTLEALEDEEETQVHDQSSILSAVTPEDEDEEDTVVHPSMSDEEIAEVLEESSSSFPDEPTRADLSGPWPILGQKAEGTTLDPSETGERRIHGIIHRLPEDVTREQTPISESVVIADVTESLSDFDQAAIAEAIKPPAPSEEIPIDFDDEEEPTSVLTPSPESVNAASLDTSMPLPLDGDMGLQSGLGVDMRSGELAPEAQDASMVVRRELVLPDASMDHTSDLTTSLPERATAPVKSRAPLAQPGSRTDDFDAPTEALTRERALKASPAPAVENETPEVPIPATRMLSLDIEGPDQTGPITPRAEDADEEVISSALHLPDALSRSLGSTMDPESSAEASFEQSAETSAEESQRPNTVHLGRRRGRPTSSKPPPEARAVAHPLAEHDGESTTQRRNQRAPERPPVPGSLRTRLPDHPKGRVQADPEAETQHRQDQSQRAEAPAVPNRRGPVNLLDIPLDPDDFQPPPPQAPAQTAPKATPAPQPPAIQPPAIRPPALRPAPRAQAPRAPAPRPAPPPIPRSEGEPLPSVEARQPPAPVPTPVPMGGIAVPEQPEAPIPDYGEESSSPFGSYYDGRGQGDQESARHDAVDHIVDAPEPQRPRKPSRDHPGTVAAPSVPNHRGTVLKALGLGGLVMALVLGLLSTWRYIAVADALDDTLAETEKSLQDGNFISRVDGSERLPEAIEAGDPLARAGDALMQLLGKGGIEARQARGQALLARLHAERVALYGDLPDLEAAQTTLARARTAAPEAIDTGLAEALMALHGHQYDSARTLLQNLATKASGHPEIEYVLARVALAEGQREVALDRLRATLKLDPEHVNAHMLMARVKRGDAQEALQAYDEILEARNAQHVDTRIARGRLQIESRPNQSIEAVEQLKMMLQVEQPQMSQAQVARIHEAIGTFYLKNNDVDVARRAFKSAVDAAPDDPRFATGLARLDLAEFKLTEAEAMLARAISLVPESATHRAIMARLRLLQGDPGGALKQLDAIERPDAEALMLRGQAHLDLAQWREAERALEKAVRADSGLLDAEIRLQLAAYLNGRALGLSRLEEIQKGQVRSGMRLEDPTLPHRAFGQALARSKSRDDVRKAMAQFKQAVLSQPDDFRGQYAMCRLYMRLANADGALTHCKTTVRINPHFAPAVLDQSAISEAQRDAGGVIASLAPFIEQRPSHPQNSPAVRRLARAYVHRGLTLAGSNDGERFLRKAEGLINNSKLNVNEASRRYVRGLLFSARGEQKRALPELAAASDQLSNDPYVHLSHADVLMRQQAPGKAASYYRRAVKAGGLADAALGAARAALSLGDGKMALNSANEAERLALRSLSHPRVRAEALSIQAQVAFERGGRRDRAKAERLAQRALKISADLPSALITLGRLAEGSGALDVAAARFQRATQVDLRNPEAQYRLGRLLVTQDETRGQGMEMLSQVINLDPDGRWGQLARRERQQ
ncbi:MAG: tetratricopeptide repeat protein [Bradymonadia bacterium]